MNRIEMPTQTRKLKKKGDAITMMFATGIIARQGCTYSNTQEIDEIRIEGKPLAPEKPELFAKAELYYYLKKHPNSIKVGVAPYPYLKPISNPNGENYIRSDANDTPYDNLLNLTRIIRLKGRPRRIYR